MITRIIIGLVILLMFFADSIDAAQMKKGQQGGNIGKKTSPLTGGLRMLPSCTHKEKEKITAAYNILMTNAVSNFSTFQACLERAPLVESRCIHGGGPKHAGKRFRSTDVLIVECSILDIEKADTAGEAAIGGEKIYLNHDYVQNPATTALELAGLMAHEVMHNYRYNHVENPAGSPYYHNTMPQQARACVVNHAPNPSAGPIAGDMCDYNGATQRSFLGISIHACPDGSYMTGAHLDSNTFLCRRFGRGYAPGDVILDKRTQLFGMMHGCPERHAMTGLHVGKNYLLCAPIAASGTRTVDGDDEAPNQRHEMHACPAGSVMTGIHADNNDFACEQVP